MPSTPSQKSIDVCRSAPTIVMWCTPWLWSLRIRGNLRPGGAPLGAARPAAPPRRAASGDARRCATGEVGARQTGQRQGAEQQAEVAQGDVAVAADGEQREKDPGQPAGDDEAADAWRDEDDEPGDDLDDAHDVHGVLGRAGQDVV